VSPKGDEPTRYHMLTLDLRNLVLVPALSIRFGGDFRIGFAPGFMFSTGRLSFAEDLGLNAGLPPRIRRTPPATTSRPGTGSAMQSSR
jgi:hypothetical protein